MPFEVARFVTAVASTSPRITGAGRVLAMATGVAPRETSRGGGDVVMLRASRIIWCVKPHSLSYVSAHRLKSCARYAGPHAPAARASAVAASASSVGLAASTSRRSGPTVPVSIGRPASASVRRSWRRTPCKVV